MGADTLMRAMLWDSLWVKLFFSPRFPFSSERFHPVILLTAPLAFPSFVGRDWLVFFLSQSQVDLISWDSTAIIFPRQQELLIFCISRRLWYSETVFTFFLFGYGGSDSLF